MFWQMLLAFGLSFLVTAFLALLFARPGINLIVDRFVKRLLQDPYPENLAEMYNVFKKVGVQNVVEADLRANDGEPLKRPFGSPIHFSDWDQLLFNPVYLSRRPIEESVSIDTSVTIGPLAKRPLEIDLPIMIGGMAYGFGPSLRAKLALAKGVDLVNTATNTGVGPFLPEERKYTKRLIIQYNRGNWGKEEEVLRQADMIEVQLGYGALGPAPVVLDAEDISEEFREYMKLRPGTELKLDSTLDGITTKRALTGLVDYLKKVTNGVPVGVKIGATHYLEKELDILVGAGVDFVTIDGAEGGINFGPAILADDCGLPTLPALCRAAAYFQKNRLDKKVSLIISGGLFNPGQFLKAIALGADAVYIGTIAMLVIAHLQVSKTIPWEPPTELVYERGKFKDELDIEKGALNIANYLKSCKEEMVLALRSMGRTSLAELTLKDLCALTPDISSMTRTELGLYAPMLASEGTND